MFSVHLFTPSFAWAVAVSLLGIASCKTPEASQRTNLEQHASNPVNGYTEKGEVQVVKGELYATKGAQTMIGGVILSDRELEKVLGSDWRAQVIAWRSDDTVVEVKGRHDVYHCGQMEQCLTDGELHFLNDLVYIRAAVD